MLGEVCLGEMVGRLWVSRSARGFDGMRIGVVVRTFFCGAGLGLASVLSRYIFFSSRRSSMSIFPCEKAVLLWAVGVVFSKLKLLTGESSKKGL